MCTFVHACLVFRRNKSNKKWDAPGNGISPNFYVYFKESLSDSNNKIILGPLKC